MMRTKNGLADSREMFANIDEGGREAWIQLLDQGIHTLREAAQRDYGTFLQVVYALERAGYEGDATVRHLAGLNQEKETRCIPFLHGLPDSRKTVGE